jgi:hypothetical protein
MGATELYQSLKCTVENLIRITHFTDTGILRTIIKKTGSHYKTKLLYIPNWTSERYSRDIL